MDEGILFLILLALASFLGFAFGAVYGIENMEDQAVEKGYAQYHPKTGDWEWLEVKEVNP